MRNELLAARMRYLVSAVKNLRNMISTKEMATNQCLLKQFELIEWQLNKMEDIYAAAIQNRSVT